MATNRIRIAKDKAELIQDLLNTKDTTGAFSTYADIIAFAAALGASQNKRLPLEHIAKEPNPIALEIFISRGYDVLIKLLAITDTQKPEIISLYQSENEEKQLQIFEEYANGGLEILREQLRGTVDYTERLLLILTKERFPETIITEEFDLTKFL